MHLSRAVPTLLLALLALGACGQSAPLTPAGGAASPTPGEAPGGGTSAAPAGAMAVEAVYTLPNQRVAMIASPADGVQRIAARLTYPLADSDDAARRVASSTAMLAAVPDNARLIYWVARTPEDPTPILVSVGADEPLAGLRLGDAPGPILPPERFGEVVSVANAASLGAPLAGPDARLERLTVWLEAGAGARYPVEIGAVSHVATAAEAKASFENVYMALVRRSDGSHQLIMLIPDSAAVGPPPDDDARRCDNLVGNDHWTRFLRQLHRCPPVAHG
ncbi:MAG TPA: hypothetical protein PKD53_03700 [Chloroflexaceae bacterium]|nr:hypothetical protein [Chloroflexaceae bacterium]